MESGGVQVDLSVLKQMESIINDELQEAERACHRAAGRPFQVSSSVQVRRLLYDELQLRPHGNSSTSEVEVPMYTVCLGREMTYTFHAFLSAVISKSIRSHLSY